MANYPFSSFINLFSNITYNKDENPYPILDIWDAYVISPFYKKDLQFFEIYTIKSNDTWAGLALKFFGDARLWWILPMFNDIEDPFIIMDSAILTSEVYQLKIIKSRYLNDLLLNARQAKIVNDRNVNVEE